MDQFLVLALWFLHSFPFFRCQLFQLFKVFLERIVILERPRLPVVEGIPVEVPADLVQEDVVFKRLEVFYLIQLIS